MLKLPSTIPAAGRKLLQSVPVARGEDAAAFKVLAEAVISDLQPRDIIEGLLVRDVVRHQWDIGRWRRIEGSLLLAPQRQAEERAAIIQKFAEEQKRFWEGQLDKASPGWRDRPRSPALQRLEKINSTATPETEPETSKTEPETSRSSVEAGLGSSLAQSFRSHGVELDRISRALFISESRRNNALRELEMYRNARQRAA